MKKIIINLLLFQVGWLVCVIGGDLYAIVYTLLALLAHQWLVADGVAEWKFIAVVAAAGCIWDISMARGGVIDFADASLLGIPLWLVCLWLLFATTFRHCLLWLSNRPGLALALAAVFGPASYWAGSQLSDATLAAPLFAALAVMALGWAILFPTGIYYAGRLKT